MVRQITDNHEEHSLDRLLPFGLPTRKGHSKLPAERWPRKCKQGAGSKERRALRRVMGNGNDNGATPADDEEL